MTIEINIHTLRAMLEKVKEVHGTETARAIVHEIGGAKFLIDVDPTKYGYMYYFAEALLRNETGDGLSRASHRLQHFFEVLEKLMGELMSAKDNLRDAVDAAANEMTKAADFIKNHPATADDPELQSFADRLTASAQALGAVDVDAATSGTTSGTTTSAGDTGTVSSGGMATDTGSGGATG